MNGQITKRWLYQDALNPVAELDSANNVVARYVYGNKANVPEYIVKSDTTYKVISDHLGSVRLVINTSTGNIAQQINYDAWGNQVLNLGSNISSLSFAGGIYDEHTELVRFGARDYNPTIGRWISKDPIGFGGGVSNLYEYCVNDPINSIDINGKQNITKLISAVGNWANGIRLGVSGSIKYMGALAFAETGVGAVGLTAWGAWNLNAGYRAILRGNQQWSEGINESISDASWRNFLGLLPYGTEFDDPCEKSIKEVYGDGINNILDFILEMGIFF